MWKDKEITPDEWEINYTVAHQNVTKLSEDNYSTSLNGVKFKVAHKRADKENWSATPKTQRKRVIKFLKGLLADLEEQLLEEEKHENEKVVPLRPAAKKKAAKKKEKAA